MRCGGGVSWSSMAAPRRGARGPLQEGERGTGRDAGRHRGGRVGGDGFRRRTRPPAGRATRWLGTAQERLFWASEDGSTWGTRGRSPPPRRGAPGADARAAGARLPGDEAPARRAEGDPRGIPSGRSLSQRACRSRGRRTAPWLRSQPPVGTSVGRLKTLSPSPLRDTRSCVPARSEGPERSGSAHPTPVFEPGPLHDPGADTGPGRAGVNPSASARASSGKNTRWSGRMRRTARAPGSW